jgi:hypothetical protein
MISAWLALTLLDSKVNNVAGVLVVVRTSEILCSGIDLLSRWTEHLEVLQLQTDELCGLADVVIGSDRTVVSAS